MDADESAKIQRRSRSGLTLSSLKSCSLRFEAIKVISRYRLIPLVDQSFSMLTWSTFVMGSSRVDCTHTAFRCASLVLWSQNLSPTTSRWSVCTTLSSLPSPMLYSLAPASVLHEKLAGPLELNVDELARGRLEVKRAEMLKSSVQPNSAEDSRSPMDSRKLLRPFTLRDFWLVRGAYLINRGAITAATALLQEVIGHAHTW